MDERRGGQRHRVLKGARIVFNEGRSTISCTVRNLSGSGALLRVESVLGIPDQFALVVSGDAARCCDVVRRTANELGVAFTVNQRGS